MSELRVRKMQEFIKQEVSSMLLREVKDPRLGFVTVTGVHLTGDLREATVYVSLFGSEKEKKESMTALEMATGFIRRELGKRLKIYYMSQVGTCPPKFLLSINDRELLHFSYTRYLENQIRQNYSLVGVPFSFVFKERSGKK